MLQLFLVQASTSSVRVALLQLHEMSLSSHGEAVIAWTRHVRWESSVSLTPTSQSLLRSLELTPQVGMLASSAAASCCCDSASALPLALSAVPAVAGAAAAIEARPSHHKNFIVPRDRWLPCGPPKRRGHPVWRRCSGLYMNFDESQSH